MSIISWITPRGDLGTISENVYFSYQLQAEDSSEQDLFYSFVAGKLPAGIYVTTTGQLRGIPAVVSAVDQISTNTFTIRATNSSGNVADRTFSLSVSNITGPIITPRPDYFGAWFDGSFVSYNFGSVNDNPNSIATWSVVQGSIPPGLTFTSAGRLFGYVDIIAENYNDLGYEINPYESEILDPISQSTDRYYNFQIKVTDGFKMDTQWVRMLIVSKGNYTSDNDITIINNTFITIDGDQKYRPIIINDLSNLPSIVYSGTNFYYKMIAYDPEDEDISWEIDEIAFSGMDDLDAADDQELIGNGTSGPYTLDQAPSNAARIVVRVNDILYTAYTDYTTFGDQLTFTSLIPTATDLIFIQFISVSTGFDTILFDQGASGLPSGLIIDEDTGWIQGILPAQTDDIVSYVFNVYAYRTINNNYISDPFNFVLNIKRSLNEEIVWTTATNLGTIDNGAISEIAVSAYNTLGKELRYDLIYAPFRKIPQGLRFLSSGRMVGRVSFRYFSLDGQQAILNVTSTDDLVVGMTIQGVGVATGCRLVQIIDATTIRVQPALYVSQGTILTFANDQSQIQVSTISNSISTAIDGGSTTFDRLCGFTIRASALDGSVSLTKSFQINVRPKNLAPYENVYLKALPSYEKRLSWENITKDTAIFPTDLIYRPDDLFFGVQKKIKSLFVAGLNPSDAATFVESTRFNHFFKKINYGEIKTARATDSRGITTYEVVYVDLIDDAYAGGSTELSIVLNLTNNFLYENSSYNTIYPNNFPNMLKRLENGIGYINKSTLPRWMTSVQDNGTVLGFVRAAVLVYTKPGASKLISYRLQQSGFKIASIPFVTDRYQWDNYLSKFYNTSTNLFEPSETTSFDKYANRDQNVSIIDTLIVNDVNDSSLAVIENNKAVGYGWVVTSRAANITFTSGTFITNVTGNTITISSNITAIAGTTIRINGDAIVDYAVSVPFNSINGKNLSAVRNNFLIDGIVNFVKTEKIIFSIQSGFDEINSGWIDSTGATIPGYLDKVSGYSSVNQQSGIWEINWIEFPTLGFDDDSVGFDQESSGLSFGHFDQGDDAEIKLTFVSEVILNQEVRVRTGDTYVSSTLVYKFGSTAIPTYSLVEFISGLDRTSETTFDGGTCVMRQGFSANNSSTGGTRFRSNQDVYIVPESQDKYIKFPKTGVFI